jgi:two-component system response regulator
MRKQTNVDVPMLHVLVVEDNPADMLLVREVLSEEHVARVLHVIKDGEQAINFIEGLDSGPGAPSLDMLLLDMHLPKRDGREILKRLQSTKQFAQIPVIVMTASDAPADYEEAYKRPTVHYFRKPSTLSGFVQSGVIVRKIAPHRWVQLENSGIPYDSQE